jgi:hypothetical protein
MRVNTAVVCASLLMACSNDAITNVRLDDSQTLEITDSVSLSGNVASEHASDVIVTWGDGSSSSLLVPAGAPLEAGHQYQVEGEFGVEGFVCGEFGECTRQALGQVEVTCSDPAKADVNANLDDGCEVFPSTEDFGRCSLPWTIKSGERSIGNTTGVVPVPAFHCSGEDNRTYSAYKLNFSSPGTLEWEIDTADAEAVVMLGPPKHDCAELGHPCSTARKGSFKVPRGEHRVLVAPKDAGKYAITFTIK